MSAIAGSARDGGRTLQGRGKFPPWILPRYAGAKSEKEFEKRARSWGLELNAGSLTVIPSARYPKGGFVAVPQERVEFSGPDPVHEAAEWLLRQI